MGRYPESGGAWSDQLRAVLYARRKDLGALAIIVGFYALLQCFGVTCPIKYLTGVSCAGCGMTRAWLSLLQGDVSSAFAYHPLFLLPIPAVILFLFRKKLPRWIAWGGLAVIVAAFCVVYGIRMLSPEDTIVVFEPQEGLIWRVISGLWQQQ